MKVQGDGRCKGDESVGVEDVEFSWRGCSKNG